MPGKGDEDGKAKKKKKAAKDKDAPKGLHLIQSK